MSRYGFCWDERDHQERARRDAQYDRKDRDYYERHSFDSCKQAYTKEFDRERDRIEMQRYEERREEERQAEQRAIEARNQRRREAEWEEQQREEVRQQEAEEPEQSEGRIDAGVRNAHGRLSRALVAQS